MARWWSPARRSTTVPLGTWAHVEMLVHLGEPGMAAAGPAHLSAGDHDSRWSTAGVRRSVLRQRRSLREISWFGFSMGPQPGGVYYVDNLQLTH